MTTIIGKNELVHLVSSRAGLKLGVTNKVIEALQEIVCEEVAKGQAVRLMGFGTWELRKVGARRVKSIRGGQEITIPRRLRVGFSVGAVLATSANGRVDGRGGHTS